MKRAAFTLIELMIVVAIIGVLAAIAIPKFASLINKSREGQTKGTLATLRTAISVYYSDTGGIYPMDDLTVLSLNGKYISGIPPAKLPNTPHPDSGQVNAASSEDTLLTDEGGWSYDSNSSDHNWGRLIVNCLHPDNNGTVWSTF